MHSVQLPLVHVSCHSVQGDSTFSTAHSDHPGHCNCFVQDLHTPQVLSALQSLSTASLELQAVPPLQQQLISQATGNSCHGQLTFSSKRARLGRLRVDQQLFRLLPSGGVEVFAAPQGVVLDARTLVQSALGQQQQQQQVQTAGAGDKQQQLQQQDGPGGSAGGAGAAADGQMGKMLASSMRLDVSEQVRGCTDANGSCMLHLFDVQPPSKGCHC